MEDFVALATVIKVNRFIIKQTIVLRKTYRIKLPDAIIAATALVYNLTLITHNVKDFENIQGLTVVKPIYCNYLLLLPASPLPFQLKSGRFLSKPVYF
jgi:predicted nucleic acid-binding protein